MKITGSIRDEKGNRLPGVADFEQGKQEEYSIEPGRFLHD